MSCAKVISQFEVFAADDLGRRRTWTDAEKLRIVEESYRGQRQGSVVARRNGVSRSLLTQWRKAYHLGLLQDGRAAFSPVQIGPAPRTDPHPTTLPAHQTEERIEIMLANGRRLVLSASIDVDTLARLIQVLERA